MIDDVARRAARKAASRLVSVENDIVILYEEMAAFRALLDPSDE